MTISIVPMPVSGTVRLRARHRLGCAAAALCAGGMGMAGFAAPALAQDECGAAVNGSVTCSASASYPNGITYSAVAPITVNAPLGVSVVTTNPNGITISSTGASALTGAANVQAVGGTGVLVTGGTTSSVQVQDVSEQDGSGIRATAGAGSATVQVRNTTITGAGGSALTASAIGGDADVTLNGIASTSGTSADVVSATSTTGAANVTDNGQIKATGASSRGIYALGATAASVTGAGSVSTTGDYSAGIDAAAAPIQIVAGAVPSILLVVATPAVAVSIGSVSTMGLASDGIDASSGTDPVIVNAASIKTTGDSSSGVVASSDSGAVTVTTGTVSTAGTTSSGIIALSNSGPVIVNAGTTTVSGTGGNAINALGSSVAIASGAAHAVDSAAIVALSLSGPASVHLTGGAVTSTGSDGVTITGATTAMLTVAAGSSVYGGVNGASIDSETGTTVTNAGTLGGTIYALATTSSPALVNNTGTINGAIALGGGRDIVNNSGTFNAAGTSTFAAKDVFNNSGLLAVAAPGGVPATVRFLGLGSFNNSGTIELRNGVTGDTLALGGNYVGSGNATLGVDVTPGAILATDRLQVGGTATGSTQVLIALPTGAQATFSNGVTIVQAGAPSSATAFTVSPSTRNFGLARYDVVYNPATLAYNLVGAPSDSALNMLSYQTAERNLWNKSADAVSAQLQAKRDHLWNLGGTAPSGRFWVTMAASYDHANGYHDFGTLGQNHETDTSYQQDYFGGQAGFDLSGGLSSRGGFSVGVTGGYINSKVKLGNTLDNIAFDAVNGGAYASFTSGHIFATALGKYDYYWATPESQNAGFNLHLHGHSYGVRGELGVRLGGDSFFVEPLAQISYLRTSLDPFAVQGTSVNFDDRDALRGKAGGRIGGNTSLSPDTKLAFYAGASYVHDFQGESQVTFTNLGGIDTVYGLKARDSAEGLVGINIASTLGISGFMEATYTRSFGSGDNGLLTENGAGGRAGIRVKF